MAVLLSSGYKTFLLKEVEDKLLPVQHFDFKMTAFAQKEDKIYVATYDDVLYVFQYDEDAKSEKLKEIAKAEGISAEKLGVADDTHLYALRDYEIYIIDAENLKEIGKLDLEEEVQSFAVFNGYLYVADEGNVYVYRINSPDDVEEIATIDDSSCEYVKDLKIDEQAEKLYKVCSNRTTIWDISDPENPEEDDWYDMSSTDDVFFGPIDAYNGSMFVTTAETTQNSGVGTSYGYIRNTGSYPTYVCAKDENEAYIADAGYKLFKYTSSDEIEFPLKLFPLSEALKMKIEKEESFEKEDNLYAYYHYAVVDDFFVYYNKGNLHIYDISEVNKPKKLSVVAVKDLLEIDEFNTEDLLSIVGNYFIYSEGVAYISYSYKEPYAKVLSKLEKDLSAELMRVTFLKNIDSDKFSSDILVIETDEGFSFLDVTDPANIKILPWKVKGYRFVSIDPERGFLYVSNDEEFTVYEIEEGGLNKVFSYPDFENNGDYDESSSLENLIRDPGFIYYDGAFYLFNSDYSEIARFSGTFDEIQEDSLYYPRVFYAPLKMVSDSFIAIDFDYDEISIGDVLTIRTYNEVSAENYPMAANGYLYVNGDIVELSGEDAKSKVFCIR